MKVKDYQFLCSLDSGSTTYEVDLIRYFNIDTTETPENVRKKLLEVIKYEPKPIKETYIISGKTYGVEKELLDCQFEQFIQLDKILAEERNVDNLHKLLAIYLRPSKKKLFWNRIEPFDINKQEQIANELLEMNFDEALGAILFFYQNALNTIMKNIKTSYLNKQSQQMANL